uniref:Uncharacterized protein n=1 Tax=Anguilla anguilla TaxID=7936 RepID=A0A0E9W154_ANGAN
MSVRGYSTYVAVWILIKVWTM